MQKRGQIYLLAALIIGFLLFTLVLETNIVRQTVIEDDFELLSKNYEIESAKFMNNMLKTTSGDLTKDFLRFTVLFSSFAKTKNPEFGLIYAFTYKDKLYVGNYLDTDITVTNAGSNPTVLKGCYQKIDTSVSIAGLKVNTPQINVGQYTQCSLTEGIPTDNKLRFMIQDITYEVNLNVDHPEVIIVSRETKGDQRKVFVKGNFLKGQSTP